jgi:hypothetical protein
VNGWQKCSDCYLDGTYKCKVAAEKVKTVEDCHGPYKKDKTKRRRRRRR